MSILQEYFNSNEPKSRKNILLDGGKIGEIEGKTLIIDDFKDLTSIIISNLPNLEQLTIKDCENLESLEIHLDKNIEVSLMGNIKSLNNIKTNNTTKPTIIYQEKAKEGFCWGCALNSFAFFSIIVLSVIIYYFWILIKELKEFNKRLQKKLRLK